MANTASLEKEDDVIEFYGPTKIQCTWEPVSEPIFQTRKNNTKGLISEPSTLSHSKYVASHSTSNSPVVKPRPNSSSSNPFLIDDNDNSFSHADTGEFAYLFENRLPKELQHEEGDSNDEQSLRDITNFSNEDEMETINLEMKDQRQEQLESERNYVTQHNLDYRKANCYKPKRPPRTTSKTIQASPILASRKTQTSPCEKTETFNAKQHSIVCRKSNQFIGLSNHTAHHSPRVYGKKFKYMKGYMKMTVQWPSEDEIVCIADSTGTQETNAQKINAYEKVKQKSKITRRSHALSQEHCTSDQINMQSSSQKKAHIDPVDGKIDRRHNNFQERINTRPDAQETNLFEKRQNNCVLYLDEESHRQIVKLQQELKSSDRKIQKLKEMNAWVLDRKNELQKEVLDAYKKCFGLEINPNTQTSQSELSLEIRLVKQRIAELEKEAAQAISRASKLERELKVVETKRLQYYTELNTAKDRMGSLETELRETKEKMRSNLGEKNKLYLSLECKEKELVQFKERYQDLESICQRKEDNNALTLEKLDLALKQCLKYEVQNEDITKGNAVLKDELQRLLTKYEISQKNLERYTNRIEEQKSKFDLMAISKLNLEKELHEMQTELSTQRVENRKYSEKYNELSDRLNKSQISLKRAKEDCENLQKENRNLKDKVMYLDIYKQMLDEKSKQIETIAEDVKKTTPRKIEKQRHDEELNKISKKIPLLKDAYDVLHKETLKSNITNYSDYLPEHSDYVPEHSPHKEQRQLSQTQEAHFQFSISETLENSEQISGDRFFHNDNFNQTNSQQNDDVKTDDTCSSPVDFPMDFHERQIIYPSFAVGLQSSDFENNQSNFSDLLQTGNNDIANALL